MQQEESGSGSEAVGKQFGEQMRMRREERGISQRQLAELLHDVDLHLDPSAITRIERGTREVKLFEALAISKFLEFDLDYIAFSPDERFQISSSNLAIAATHARKTLLQAIRYVDHWTNHSDEETEKRLMARHGFKDLVELYTEHLRTSPSFRYGGFLGSFDGDNYAIYFNETDRAVKQAVVNAVIAHILVSENEFDEFIKKSRPAPPEVKPHASET
ncbi:helix-turn-helix domain-containing protein [Mycolicibacterium sp. 3033]|nr:helix-turn-helix domain-containing protein [Mycolicibacterium aurantiacum]